MKPSLFYSICLFIIICLGCNNQKPSEQLSEQIEVLNSTIENTQDEINDTITKKEIIICDDEKSLAYWTIDTILMTNRRLVDLMDTLYRYVRSEFKEDHLQQRLHWMQGIRKQLCNYYKETRPTDSISEFQMADSIIAEARALWNLNEDYSTMGLFIGGDVERTRLQFEHFNEFDKLYNICENETQKRMLLTEFKEWINLERTFFDIYGNCVNLRFWGGSIIGPTCMRGDMELITAHIDLYKKEYSIITHSVENWSDLGTFLSPARDLLVSTCNLAVEEYFHPEEYDERHIELHSKTKSLLEKLPARIDAWCKVRQPWEEEVSTDWLRPEYSRHTAEVLIKMANLISSIQ